MGSFWFNKLNRAHVWLALPAVTLAVTFCSEGGSGSGASSSAPAGGICYVNMTAI